MFQMLLGVRIAMRTNHCLAAGLTLLLTTAPLMALEVETLKQAETSWDGSKFHYPMGSPEVTIQKILLAASEQTTWHCHPVPVFAYMLQGRLQVRTESGRQHVFKPGDAVVEIMDGWHQGKALDGPVELVVFYAGEVGLKNTVLRSSGKSCTDSRSR